MYIFVIIDALRHITLHQLNPNAFNTIHPHAHAQTHNFRFGETGLIHTVRLIHTPLVCHNYMATLFR